MSYETLSSQIERDIEDSKWIKQEIKEAEELEAAAFERGYVKALDDVIALLMKELHSREYKADGTKPYLVDLVEQLKSNLAGGNDNGNL